LHREDSHAGGERDWRDEPGQRSKRLDALVVRGEAQPAARGAQHFLLSLYARVCANRALVNTSADIAMTVRPV